MSNYKPQPGDIVSGIANRPGLEAHVHKVTETQVIYTWWRGQTCVGSGNRNIATFIEMAEEATVRVGAFDPNNTRTEWHE